MRWIREVPQAVRSRLGPLRLGLAEGIGVPLVAALPLGVLLELIHVPAPSASLFADTANVGIVLVLAFVLEIVWLVPRLATKNDYENRLGGLTGFGISGFVAVSVALALSAHRAAGHDNLLDLLGFGWIVVALGGLAAIVVTQPLLVHEWEILKARQSAGSGLECDPQQRPEAAEQALRDLG